jgi:type I restriction enzyme S subunit
MISDLQPYPSYKDSGLPWLGQVPQHWEMRRAKFLLREVDSRSLTGKEQLLRVSQYTGVTQRKSLDGSESPNTRAASLIGYKRVYPNDLVINIMLAWNGSMGVSRYEGIASPAYCVYRFNAGALPWYFHELLRTTAYKQRIKTASTGVVESRLRLYSDDLGRIELPLPPPSEQAAIVRFLDWANGRLERAIRAKRKVIALLNEQKHAIIHRAVTRGLDPNVPMKDSGIPWLGEIPAHWELSPNRASLRVRKVLVGERHNEYTLLSLTKRGVIVRDLSEMRGKFSSDMGTSQEVRPGDLVLCLFDVPETPRTVGLSQHAGMITSAYTVMQCKDCNIAEFLELFYIAMDDRKLLSPLYSGLRNTIPKERFLGAKTPIPPAGERARILAAVREKTASLTIAISRLEREIELIREYRTRLVADVVTGKLDVREAAAQLPDEEALSDADQPDVVDTADDDDVEELLQ